MTTHDVTVDRNRLAWLRETLADEIAAGRGDGLVALVARGDEIVFHEAFGVADRTTGRPMTTDAIFNILSITKSFVNLLVLRAIERGRLLFTTPVAEVIPEFGGHHRETITILHLLTHTSGLPTVVAPVLGEDAAYLGRVVARICSDVYPVATAGEVVSYAPTVAHALLAEILCRRDPAGRSIRTILQEDLFGPLGMADTALGLPADREVRRVPLTFARDQPTPPPGMLVPEMWAAHSEMAWVGGTSTTADLFRLASTLRPCQPAPEGRLLSPAMLDLATRNHTGDRPNNLYSMLFSHARGWGDLPAYIGLGFFVRGEGFAPNRFGTLASPRTFGHTGAGSTLLWIDPERDLTFICLSAGLIAEASNFERYSRLSDIVSSLAL